MSNEADQLPIAALLPVETTTGDAAAAQPVADRVTEVRKAGRAAGQAKQQTHHREAEEPDLVDKIVAFLSRVRPELKEQVQEVAQELRNEFGGRRHYLRSDTSSERVVAVMSAFNGRNATEVARELGISRAAVYRYIKRHGRQK
jgi:hypothetical protein